MPLDRPSPSLIAAAAAAAQTLYGWPYFHTTNAAVFVRARVSVLIGWVWLGVPTGKQRAQVHPAKGRDRVQRRSLNQCLFRNILFVVVRLSHRRSRSRRRRRWRWRRRNRNSARKLNVI